MKYLILLALVGFAVAQIQVQIPIQRPQQPQPPVHWQPNPPARPQPQPPQWQQPRADWRQGQVDPRCPVTDDTREGAFPVFLEGLTDNTFFICWGRIAWPFECPGNSVWRDDIPSGPACAHPGFEPQNNNNWNRWNRRPFNGEEEEAAE